MTLAKPPKKFGSSHNQIREHGNHLQTKDSTL